MWNMLLFKVLKPEIYLSKTNVKQLDAASLVTHPSDMYLANRYYSSTVIIYCYNRKLLCVRYKESNDSASPNDSISLDGTWHTVCLY